MKLDPEILEVTYTNEGEDLKSLSEKSPVFMVFLRHFGCTFCREAMSDIADLKEEIGIKGFKLVLVHMGTDEVAANHFEQYKLSDTAYIGDPDLSLYELFGLFRGKFNQLYGLKIWLRGLKVGIMDGHGGPTLNKDLGNYKQMPGIFILKNGEIKNSFIHRTSADRPDYKALMDKYLNSIKKTDL